MLNQHAAFEGEAFESVAPSAPATSTLKDPEKATKMATTGLRSSEWCEKFLVLKRESFSLNQRSYLRPIYDIQGGKHKRIVIMAGRQVEKTALACSLVLDDAGNLVQIKDLMVGGRVSCLDCSSESSFATSEITWKSELYTKPCYRVTTRQGHIMDLGEEHPVRMYGRWVQAQHLKKGDAVAAVRRAGEFGDGAGSDSRVKILAYILGDGGFSSQTVVFTQAQGQCLEEFKACVAEEGNTYRERFVKNNVGVITLHRQSIYGWLEDLGLMGKKSDTKFIPKFVFRLTREKTKLFLNRLWSTDGCVSERSDGKLAIEYCSISKLMTRQVQSLLWKFGIPSKIRVNHPVCNGVRGQKDAYILRIETAPGMRTFLSEIGALGKSEGVEMPEVDESSNRDTYPREMNELIKKACKGITGWAGRRSEFRTLNEVGLRRTPKFRLTKAKLREYVAFFREEIAKGAPYDQDAVDELASHIDTEVFWDTIESVEFIGDQECYDISVEGHENFIVDGVVTHNSSTLANKIIYYCCRHPDFMNLYVAPREKQQVRPFSSDRVKPLIRFSPYISTFMDKTCSDQVFDKSLNNGALMYFRSCYLNADATRGLSADQLQIDEIQDILPENIPVMEEALSHSIYKYHIYSGTPKTTSNSLYFYWTLSTQREWLVKCRHCRYWNYLGEEVIGETYMQCSKCRKPIYATDGQWVIMNQEGTWEGYRISQLMVPWVKFYDPTGSEETIKSKQARYPGAKFHNEVLGLAYDIGQKPISEAELRSCCDLKHPVTKDLCNHMVDPEPWMKKFPCFGGIDWGTGAGENPSYTVLTIGAMLHPGIFCVFFIKKFEGREANLASQPEKITEICRRYNVQLIGSDWGFGAAQNSILRESWTVKRIMEFQYVGQQRKPVKFDKDTLRHTVDRTNAMTTFFRNIQRQKYKFFRWDQFKKFAVDITNIDVEYNETRQVLQYSHSPDRPDDVAHSIIYAELAAQYFHGYYHGL